MEKLYNPKMNQREFMLKALQSEDKLKPRDVLAFWKQRKAVESVDKQQKLKPESKYFDELSKEQLDALNDGYYTQLRGSVGARGFWEWFKRNDQKQKQSLEDRGKPTGETRTWTKNDGSTGVYEYKTTPFVSWRQLRAFVAAQESNQLSRPANRKSESLASTFSKEQLKPLVRYQIDTIVLQKAQVNKPEDKYGDYGFKCVFNMIDLYSGYTWQGAAKKQNGENAAAFVEKVIDSIEERFGRFPACVIRSDNGSEFKEGEFQRRLNTLEKPITFELAPSSTPNAMAYIENSNREWRNIARRLTRVQKETLSDAQLADKPYAARWYGKDGRTFREINSLMNTRGDASRGYESPARILEAAMEPSSDDDRELITKVNAAIAKAGAMRRGPSTAKALRRGDRVRLIDAAYVKAAGMRSNAQKQNPRWSEEIYVITDKRGDTGKPLKYKVRPEDSDEPLKDWYDHASLQKITRALKPDAAALAKSRKYKIDKKLDSGDVYYESFPFSEVNTGD
eukprot:COSAG01_NODE_3109_length_6574_cov_52.415907_4_plen_509_part_00